MTPAIRLVDLLSGRGDTRYELAARIAVAIIQVTRERGCCSPDDLAEKGFASNDLAEHWHMAAALAAVELKLMSEEHVATEVSPLTAPEATHKNTQADMTFRGHAFQRPTGAWTTAR